MRRAAYVQSLGAVLRRGAVCPLLDGKQYALHLERTGAASWNATRARSRMAEGERQLLVDHGPPHRGFAGLIDGGVEGVRHHRERNCASADRRTDGRTFEGEEQDAWSEPSRARRRCCLVPEPPDPRRRRSGAVHARMYRTTARIVSTSTRRELLQLAERAERRVRTVRRPLSPPAVASEPSMGRGAARLESRVGRRGPAATDCDGRQPGSRSPPSSVVGGVVARSPARGCDRAPTGRGSRRITLMVRQSIGHARTRPISRPKCSRRVTVALPSRAMVGRTRPRARGAAPGHHRARSPDAQAALRRARSVGEAARRAAR